MAANHERGFTVTLYKPFSMDHENGTIQLPCLFPPEEDDPVIFQEYVEEIDYHVFKATITTDPLTSPNDSIVVVIFGCFQELAFIRPAKDTRWTKIYIGLKQKHVLDILLHNNKLYALELGHRIISFDILDPYDSKVMLVDYEHRYSSEYKPYLVKSLEGDILQVISCFK
ncbi:hypothetical protein TorRG33x02_125160 [Trema orientale]|uniref:KIB1-4 beta-propeller domain-containing protein n=1 Tax=Trema orientale TaxID=63057 RepID=A0A2P5F1P2_TREOI|nr:hypothetical protein TorRG33x02_125160 [Trema orientale]